jgi:hypothetical protein
MLAVGLCSTLPAAESGPAARGQPHQIGRITHPPLGEASGLVKSRQHPGVFWVINDSGNEPHLYAVNRTGKLLAEYRVKGALNADWEALAADRAGHLYIGDIGNNLPIGRLPRRWVYRVKEPDPAQAPARAGPDDPLPELAVDQTYFYTFPAEPFDAEGMFFDRGSLYLVSKVSQGPTRLYRLPLERPGKSVALIAVGELAGIPAVTDAALSDDGRKLAVCSSSYAALFELEAGEMVGRLTEKVPKVVRFAPREIEGCCWDGDDLILVSETRELYRLRF